MMEMYSKVSGGSEPLKKDSLYHSYFSSSIISCLMYLPCINNKDYDGDDNDDLTSPHPTPQK